jgi:hypothetical protein
MHKGMVGHCIHLYQQIQRGKINIDKIAEQLNMDVITLSDEELAEYVKATAEFDKKLEKKCSSTDH